MRGINVIIIIIIILLMLFVLCQPLSPFFILLAFVLPLETHLVPRIFPTTDCLLHPLDLLRILYFFYFFC